MSRALKKLEPDVRSALIVRCIERKKDFLARERLQIYSAAKILIVGDCPAPSAPNDPDFHYTPFAALCHSSLYLNLQLHQGGIPESSLAWVNSADFHGNKAGYDVLRHPWSHIIALGGAAEKWLRHCPFQISQYAKVQHPSAWKRFHYSEPYPLVCLLQTLTRT